MANLLDELGWMDVQDYLLSDDRLILVVGSTEQHGRHMNLGTDAWLPWEIARRVSQRTGVLLAPALPFGMSLHHMGFPGTLSLRPHTLMAVFTDLVESAYEHGFRRILILNGHGGNTASIQAGIVEAMHELPGLEVQVAQWWQEPEVIALCKEAFEGQPAGHADAGETSLVLAIRPEVVRLDRAAYNPESSRPALLTQQVLLERFPHGVIGTDPRRASAALGARILARAVDIYEERLRTW